MKLKKINVLFFVFYISLLLLFSCDETKKGDNNGGGDDGDIVNMVTDWRDEIIYFIMTDRFFDGDPNNNITSYTDKTKINSYHGGDLKGIMDKVDYIKKLGATSIWITPVVANTREDAGNTGYAGYWAWDMSVLDESLAPKGYDATARLNYYKNFVKTMHDNGILVIQDIVVNHMGNISGWHDSSGKWKWDPPYPATGYTRVFIEDAAEWNGTENWKDWGNNDKGRRTKPPAPFNQLSFYHNSGRQTSDSAPNVILGDISGLSDLATEKREVRDALKDIYKKWINAGIDGYRIDTIKHVEDDFWDDFSPAIRTKANNKKFIQFGEALIGDHSQTAKYVQGNRLDSLLNFELFFRIKEVFAQGEATNKLTSELTSRASLRNTKIGNGGAEITAREGVVNFIDNHDQNRFMTSITKTTFKEERMRNALMYLMTTQGIPCIYYNTENNVTGNATSGRVDMADFNTDNKPTLELISQLSKLRKDNIALRRGDITKLKDSTTAGIFAFGRSYIDTTDSSKNQKLIVALNTSENPITETIDVGSYASSGDYLFDTFQTDQIIKVNDGKITVTIPAFGIYIFEKQQLPPPQNG